MGSNEERMNNLILEIRMLENTFEELSARQGYFERALMENRTALETIKSLETAGKDEVLLPIGGGVLLRSSPPSSEKVLVNVGLNVVVEKSRASATQLIEKRANEYEQNVISLNNQRSQVAERLESDRALFNAMMSGQAPVPRR